MSGEYQEGTEVIAFRDLGADDFFTKAEIMSRNGRLAFRLDALIETTQTSSAAGIQSAADFRLPFERVLLVVDDEEETPRLVSLLFKDEDYKVHWARDGADALRQAATFYPDLVVLDFHMPGLDGRETCRRLREQGRSGSLYLPIVMLTGETRPAELALCLETGADVSLTKPVDNDVLKSQIRTLLRRTRFLIDADGRITAGGVSLDCRTHKLTIAGCPAPIRLTKTEAGFLLLLMGAMGRAVDRAMLHRRRARPSAVLKEKSSVLKTHVGNIRAKLGRHCALIEAVSGESSYRFNIEAARAIR